jgi:hypothetical protein
MGEVFELLADVRVVQIPADVAEDVSAQEDVERS